MDDEQRQFLKDVGRIVRELGKWSDEKIASGTPASETELELIQKIRAVSGSEAGP